MSSDAERNTPVQDQEAEDLQFLNDVGLELLAKLRDIRDIARRRQITEALHHFLEEQVRATHH